MKRDAVFKKQLLSIAESSLHPRSHHAALIARGNRIVGTGYNLEDRHAETEALENADANYEMPFVGAVLYTLMVKPRSGKLGNGTPCAECMDAIRAAGIRKVVVYV